ncbi:MAG TPA: PQQ-binding-like beta-propeller repeat protein, partial [Isosphaeraceae bacterium]|nr:PQQ-binding-like beta-propeller repeat protein [Isosphaeraceae bacterium]
MSALHLSLHALARPRVRWVCLVTSLCLVAWLGLGGWWLQAFEPASKRQQQPEPVGAVDESDLLKAGANDANWLMYGRTYNAHRFSSLNQINTKNVARLIPVWTFQTGVLDGFECTPLVIDGIMYLTTPWNHAYAVDCKTGSQLWHYQKSLPENLALCCDAVNRGFAAWGDRLYMATLDAHLVCLDRNTGEEVWDIPITVAGENGKEAGDIYKMAYSATVAPLVVKGKVVIGISGAEYGIRGFIDAYDAKNGKRLWRFFTVPSADDKSEHAKKALTTWEGNSWLT